MSEANNVEDVARALEITKCGATAKVRACMNQGLIPVDIDFMTVKHKKKKNDVPKREVAKPRIDPIRKSQDCLARLYNKKFNMVAALQDMSTI